MENNSVRAGVIGGLVVIAILAVISCVDVSKKMPKSAQPILEKAPVALKETNKGLAETNSSINKDTKAIEAKTPAALRPTIYPHTSNIFTALALQSKYIADNERLVVELNDARKKNKDMEEWGVGQQSRADKAEASATKELQEKYTAYSGWLFFLALVCGGLAIYSKQGWLTTIAALLAVGSLVCIALVQSVALIPWIVGGVALGAFAALSYYLYRSARDGKTAAAAVKETVQTVEALKQTMSVGERKRFFGDGPTPGVVANIQSPKTSELVEQVRGDIPTAPSVPVTVARDWNGDGIIDLRDADSAPTQADADAIRAYVVYT